MLKNIFYIFILINFFSFTGIAATSNKYVVSVKEADGTVEFHAIGKPKAIKIHGKSAGPTGKVLISNGKASGELSIKLDSFNTGIKLRDSHMKEKYLEIEKYPDANLEITKLNITVQKNSKKENIPFEGLLTLHGTQAPISGKATVEIDKNSADVQAHFGFKIEDFKIETPSFAGVTMASDVVVDVSFKAPLKVAK